MEKAIVTGSTGFIGSFLVKKLLFHNVQVLALGKKAWREVDPSRLRETEGMNYIQIDMSDIESLPLQIKNIGWDPGTSCVFYNVAWGGIAGLSDLDVEAQMKNVVWAGNAIHVAKKLNCEKFVHIGTMEEVFANRYLDLNYHTNSEYNRHVIHGIAETAARKILKMISREKKIKLIIVSNSHVMGPNDYRDSFLRVTLKKLIDGDDLIFSTGEQMFDVISVHDCVNAYLLIGENGKSYKEYWVGTGQSRRLREYVEIMASLYPSGKELQFGKMPYNDISLMKEDFSIKSLTDDTGFMPSYEYEDAVHELYSWLTENKLTD